MHFLVHEHFVREGFLPGEDYERLVGVFRQRQEVDYKVGPMCDPEVARARLADARAVCEAVRSPLDAEGWLSGGPA